MVRRIAIDNELDKEVEQFRRVWKNMGLKNITKTDVVRMLVNKYKQESLSNVEISPIRKPKSKEWHI